MDPGMNLIANMWFYNEDKVEVIFNFVKSKFRMNNQPIADFNLVLFKSDEEEV